MKRDSDVTGLVPEVVARRETIACGAAAVVLFVWYVHIRRQMLSEAFRDEKEQRRFHRNTHTQ